MNDGDRTALEPRKAALYELMETAPNNPFYRALAVIIEADEAGAMDRADYALQGGYRNHLRNDIYSRMLALLSRDREIAELSDTKPKDKILRAAAGVMTNVLVQTYEFATVGERAKHKGRDSDG